MKNTKNEIINQPKANIVNTLNSLAEGIQNGLIDKYEIVQNGSGKTTIKIDSSDGKDRIINTHDEIDGYISTSTTRIKKQPPAERRKVVKKLFQDGKTQIEIAENTLCSQKTISNDIKHLKKVGEL